jgi:hypothetical protein
MIRLTNRDSRAKLLRLAEGEVTLAPGDTIETAGAVDAEWLATVMVDAVPVVGDAGPEIVTPRKRGRPRKDQADG